MNWILNNNIKSMLVLSGDKLSFDSSKMRASDNNLCVASWFERWPQGKKWRGHSERGKSSPHINGRALM